MVKKDNTPKTRSQFRSAKTGLFLSEQQAKRRDPSQVVKGRVPLPGRGDTK